LTLVQTEKATPRPILLVNLQGDTYWDGWNRFVQEEILKRRLISPEDLSLFTIVHSAREAVDEIKHFYSTYHSLRQVGRKRVLRLEKELSDENVEELNRSFGDIVQDGRIDKTTALPEEANEPELADKPRIVFEYNHKSSGRTRQLIDKINEMGVQL
jgi:hypothetical protein